MQSDKSPLAYGKWKGALSAGVAAAPPAPGRYFLSHVRGDDVKAAIVTALIPLCSVVQGASSENPQPGLLVETRSSPLHGEDGWLLVAFNHTNEGKGSKRYTYSHPVYGTCIIERSSTWVRS